MAGFNLGKNKNKQEKNEEKLTWQQRFMVDLHDFIYVLAIFMIVYMLMFRVVVVVGDSMNNTLVDGDRLVLLGSTVYRNPKQGDVIVASKQSFKGGECIIKRVIATEGQTVSIDSEGVVYVDGVALDEEYTYIPTTYISHGDIQGVTVPENCYFVMGDNRNNSTDSRSSIIGFIDKREILGRAFFLMSPGDNHGLGKADYGRIGFGVFK